MYVSTLLDTIGAMALPSLTEPVEDNGYRWWYIDAISDDSRYALTAIVFIGSVFSPWYSWARKKGHTPALEHCSINLALYGPNGRWCMTERNAASVVRTPNHLQIGPSAMQLEGNSLVLNINEWSVPLPRRMQGQLRIELTDFDAKPVTLDSGQLHQWQPVAPRTRIKVHMNAPTLQWNGTAYLDSNAGCVPLEQTFSSWNWSRSHEQMNPAQTTIRYDIVERGQRTGRHTGQLTGQHTFDVDQNTLREVSGENDEHRDMPSTFWFRVPRQTRCTADAEIQQLETLEDTPFYSRSRYVEQNASRMNHVVHESLYLDRFDHPITRSMLPFRMPRIPHPVNPERVKNHA